MLLALVLVVAASAQAQDPFQSGIAALERKDLAAAQASLEEATRLSPQNARAWVLLARTYAERKDRNSAVAAAQKAEQLGAGDPAVLQALANLYAGVMGDPVKAARLGAQYAERKPEDKTAWRRLAAFCLSTGQTERAVEAATKGLGVDASSELRGILGQAYLERKDWDKAAAEFAEAVRIDPYDEGGHFRLAQVYLLRQDFPSAGAVLEKAKQYFDRSPQIELALGVAYYGQRAFSKAVDQFLKTIRLAPEVPQPYVFLGRILEHASGRLPEVIARFAEFEARNPGQSLGYVLHAKGIVAQLPPGADPPEARTALELIRKALALKEDDAEAHHLMGVLLERRGDFGNAATHLERAIALNPKDPAPHFRLARVYAQLGRMQESRRERELHEKLSEAENSASPPGLGLEPARPPASNR